MNKNIYVGGLPYSVTDERLRETFSTHGSVESARVITDKYSGESRGFGFVEMEQAEDAQKAIQNLDGQEFKGRNLKVNLAKPREDRGGGGGRRW